MNRIVRENCPVADLAENLRDGSPGDDSATVTIQLASLERNHVPTFKELLSIRRPPYRSTEEIVEELRHERDAWDS